jgi:hypothetical protein
MKTLVQTISLFAITLLISLSSSTLKAGGNETNSLEIHLRTSENMILPGNSLLMDLEIPSSGTTHLSVTDVNGREVWKNELSCKAGQNRVKFRIGEMAPGTYFLKVSSGGQSQTQTFAVR